MHQQQNHFNIFFEKMNYQKLEPYILNKLQHELPKHLHYHSIHHVLDVLHAAVQIAANENISASELVLLKTAVLFHDSGFIVKPENHEETGCEIAKKTLPDFDYTKEAIEKICGMIMATKIPQTPLNHLEQIICDADLDYLGRDDYWKISENLFLEINETKTITASEWNNIQIRFFEAHHYFTKTAIALRKEKKEFFLNALKKKNL